MPATATPRTWSTTYSFGRPHQQRNPEFACQVSHVRSRHRMLSNSFWLKRNSDTFHVAPQGQRCHVAFTGDLTPALLVLGTDVEIAGMQGRPTYSPRRHLRRVRPGPNRSCRRRARRCCAFAAGFCALGLFQNSRARSHRPSARWSRGAPRRALRHSRYATLRPYGIVRRTTSLNAGLWHKLLMP